MGTVLLFKKWWGFDDMFFIGLDWLNSLKYNLVCFSGPSNSTRASVPEDRQLYSPNEEATSIASKCLENIPKYPAHILNELKKGFRSVNILKYAKRRQSCSEENLVRYFSDSQLILAHTFVSDQCNRPNKMNLKKSFSTDDLSLL